MPTGIEFMEIPPGKTLLCRFNGPYQKTAAAYTRFMVEMKARGLQPVGSPWESYVSDPKEIKDPMAVRTEIYWPVAELKK